MEDSPEDLPKPPRRTAARPFFSPRPEGVTGPLELNRRRSAQLFTPPGASPVAPSAPAAAQLPVQPRADESPKMLDPESLAQRNTTDDGDQLFVEQYEPKEIELTSASATTEPEHAIEVIEYDDANSYLRAAAKESETPQVDGLRIETTEFSFHRDAGAEPPPNVESFWATEPFGAASAQASHADSASETREEREVEHAEMALDEAEASPASSQSLEELKEAEPWAVSPAVEEPVSQEPVSEEPVSEEPSMEDRFTRERAIPAPASHPVADALERIAARVRAGELELVSGSESSDAAALAAVLTALLRQSR
ncbi:MAG TPA: hypothetical protein VN717_05605 [Gemmatimonadaceae bacterium]|nr:hypothetical protein [Gemmatimonadaceae bacterium]